MQEKTEWHRLVLWNSNYSKLADIAERYCKKGDKIYVEGSIEYRSWQDKEGQTKYTTEIRVNELILLSGRGGDAEGEAPAPRMAAASSPRKAKEGSVDEFPEAFDAEGQAPAPRKSAAAAPRKAKEGEVDEFPEARAAEDDDLPF